MYTGIIGKINDKIALQRYLVKLVNLLESETNLITLLLLIARTYIVDII